MIRKEMIQMVEFTETFIPNILMMLQVCYKKILKINLTENRYSLVYINKDEKETYEHVNSEQADIWFHYFIEHSGIHPDDIKNVKSIIQLDYLSNAFQENSSNKINFKYRILQDKKYIWQSILILPSVDYTDENKKIVMYIKDVDDFSKEIEYKVQLEELSYIDGLTKIQNRNSYNRKIASVEKENKNIAVIFIDLNCLKYVNDTKGHCAGDYYIQNVAMIIWGLFGKDNCYRIGGDELIVIINCEDQKELNIAVYKLLQSIHNRDFEFRIASIGTAFGNSRNIKEIIQKAEEKMYEDKKEFYKIHPEYDARIKRFNA